MTSYLSRKLLIKWSFIPCIFRCISALPTLVDSSVGHPRYLTSSLAAGGSHTVPVSSYTHPPSASAKQAYRPPVWSFGIHFAEPFGKHPSHYLWYRAPDTPLIQYQFRVIRPWSSSLRNVSNHLFVVVSTVSHDADYWLPLAMPLGRLFGTFGDHFRSRSELLRYPYGTTSASIKLGWSFYNLCSALAVTLIILLVSALVGTLDIRSVLGVLIISNCSPAFLWVCFLFLLQL